MKSLSYTEQADLFAKENGIKLKVLDKDFGFMPFDEGKKCRWVFKLKLTRNNKTYTFKFGQSIAAGENDPTMYDVLTCLTKYDPMTFDNFCYEFGLNEDSIKALKSYKAVVREFNNVNRLFGDIMEDLQEIQ